jgi:hypothetical protein
LMISTLSVGPFWPNATEPVRQQTATIKSDLFISLFVIDFVKLLEHPKSNVQGLLSDV